MHVLILKLYRYWMGDNWRFALNFVFAYWSFKNLFFILAVLTLLKFEVLITALDGGMKVYVNGCYVDANIIYFFPFKNVNVIFYFKNDVIVILSSCLYKNMLRCFLNYKYYFISDITED